MEHLARAKLGNSATTVFTGLAERSIRRTAQNSRLVEYDSIAENEAFIGISFEDSNVIQGDAHENSAGILSHAKNTVRLLDMRF